MRNLYFVLAFAFLPFIGTVAQSMKNEFSIKPALSIRDVNTLYTRYTYTYIFKAPFSVSFETGYLSFYKQSGSEEWTRQLESVNTFSIFPEFRLSNQSENFEFYFGLGPSFLRWHHMYVRILYHYEGILDFNDPPVRYILGYRSEIGFSVKLSGPVFLGVNASIYKFSTKDDLDNDVVQGLINFGIGISYKF